MLALGDAPVRTGGAFDIDGAAARWFLAAPNPDGRSNADVVRFGVNGLDVTRRPLHMWIIEFGVHLLIAEATRELDRLREGRLNPPGSYRAPEVR